MYGVQQFIFDYYCRREGCDFCFFTGRYSYYHYYNILLIINLYLNILFEITVKQYYKRNACMALLYLFSIKYETLLSNL